MIGIDWGTTSLRAFWLDSAGMVREARERPWGVRHLPAGGFQAALVDITADWPSLPPVACGMIGSNRGWRETPYVELPADATRLARHLVRVDATSGRSLHIVPGVHGVHGPDVMRGEETQLIGALALHPELRTRSTWALPGTHSKWVSVRDNAIDDFATFMTGELFALLRQHSILAADRSRPGDDPEAFERGVLAARASAAEGAFARLFSARALVLDKALPAASVADYISGLLIGEEWRSALAGGRFNGSQPVQLIGATALCARYRRAARHFGVAIGAHIEHAAAHGLWHIADLAGLSDRHPSTPPTQASRC
jgi:2-dehydro-3-deoxygalactonokinase